VVYYWGVDTIDHVGGHGTHVASTIAGSKEGGYGLFEGVAPDAKLAFFDISNDLDDIHNGGTGTYTIS
jgi:subtilisin family serine protease